MEGVLICPSRPHKRHFRGIHEDKRLAAAVQVEQWGYPRRLTVDEILKSVWGQYGEDVLFWYTGYGDKTVSNCRQTFMVHACAAPGARGRLGTPREMAILEGFAEILGATRLIVPLGYDRHDSHRALCRFLAHRGWEEHPEGMIRDLGG